VPGGGFVLIVADITERKRAEQAIRAARDAAESALRELQTAQASLVHAQKMAALGQVTADGNHNGRTAQTAAETTLLPPSVPSLPLDHLGRHYRVDLQVKVLNADDQIPTVYPPELFGSEFTTKFVSFRASTASATIGVNRQIRRVLG
jgi:hypothetical protein